MDDGNLPLFGQYIGAMTAWILSGKLAVLVATRANFNKHPEFVLLLVRFVIVLKVLILCHLLTHNLDCLLLCDLLRRGGNLLRGQGCWLGATADLDLQPASEANNTSTGIEKRNIGGFLWAAFYRVRSPSPNVKPPPPPKKVENSLRDGPVW